MRCGPVRYRVNAKAQAALRPFEHMVTVRPTGSHSNRSPDLDQRNEFLSLTKELVEDEGRNRLICEDVIRVVREARSPLVLTERNQRLDALAARLSGSVCHLVVLREGARTEHAQSGTAGSQRLRSVDICLSRARSRKSRFGRCVVSILPASRRSVR
jgi:hypothetical protein